MSHKRFKTLLITVSLMLISVCVQAADYNGKYAAPFGSSMPDVRVENGVRFSYFTNQGEVEGVDRGEHGAILGFSIAQEDFLGLEISSQWAHHKETISILDASCQGQGDQCVTERESYLGNMVTLAFVPKYRIATLDWFWATTSVALKLPLDLQNNDLQLYELDPGFQFYFIATPWLGIELDLNYMMHITDPEDLNYESDVEKEESQKRGTDTDFFSAFYARANFVFKPAVHHYLMLFAESEIWFHSVDDERTLELKDMIHHISQPQTNDDVNDLRYYANRKVNLGGGYRANVGPMEAGVGAWGAVTQTDRRHNWGIDVDLRLTF